MPCTIGIVGELDPVLPVRFQLECLPDPSDRGLRQATRSAIFALNVALHNLGQDVFPVPVPVPVVFVGAGLPSLPAVFADAASYAERLYDYRQIGLLDTASTADALTSPAHTNGVEREVDAPTRNPSSNRCPAGVYLN